MNPPLVEAPLRRLPFGFAKRHGVILQDGVEPCLAHRPGVELVALAEARRFAGRRLPLKPLSVEAFDQALAQAYQHDSSAAMQLAEDLAHRPAFSTAISYQDVL